MAQFKNTMREIMTMAWGFVKRNGYTMSEALKVAWRNFRLKMAMKQKVAHFYFRKIDGSVREAWGTLAESIVPATNSNSGRKPNPTVQTYFDTEKGEWRCYRIANLLSIA